MPLAQYSPWLKGIVIALPIVAGPITDAIIGIPIRNPAIVQSLNTQHEGAALLFTASDSVTRLPHTLLRADWPGAIDGAWVSQNLNHPAAIFAAGYTYWGTINESGEVSVHWFALNDGTSGSLVIDTITTGGGAGLDDHASPSFLLLASGRLAIFYSPHNAPPVRCRIQSAPGDPTSWGDAVTIEDSGMPTYAVPVQLHGAPGADGGRIWVFYRDAAHGYRLCYRTSTDACGTWSPKTWIFQSPDNAGRHSTLARPYLHAKPSGDGLRIHFALSDGHPNEVTDPATGVLTNSIYHCYFDSVTGLVHRSDGAPVSGGTFAAPPTDGFDTWGLTRVNDGSSEQRPYWHWDLQLTAQGLPVIASLVYTGAGPAVYAEAQPVVSRWNGSTWVTATLSLGLGRSTPIAQTTIEPFYHGGLCLKPDDPLGVLYLSHDDPQTRQWSVYRVTSPDAGATWRVDQRLSTARGSERKCIRPVAVAGYPGAGPEVFWMEGHYGDFQPTFTWNGSACEHNLFATGIQSYPRMHDSYVAFVKTDLGASPTTIHMYWDNPAAPEQASPASLFSGWYEYPRDIHWNRWDTARTLALPGCTAFTATFIGRWSRPAFLPPQHTFFSDWTGVTATGIRMCEFSSGSDDVALMWNSNTLVGNAPWGSRLTPQSWTVLTGAWDASDLAGALQPYWNDSPLAPVPASSLPMPLTHPASTFRLGHSPDQTGNNWWRGQIAFVGIANTKLPAAWVGEFARSNPFDPAWSYASFGTIVSWDFPAPCPVDLNHDGLVTSQDLFDFLTAFFTQAPAADFNHDGSTNSQDFFGFLVAFFAGC